jgi:hypothetical protein
MPGVKEPSWNKSHAMSRLSSEDYAQTDDLLADAPWG